MVVKKSILIIGEVESQNLGDQAIFFSLKSELLLKGLDVEGECLSCKPVNKTISTNTYEPKSKIKQLHTKLYSKYRIYTKIFNLVSHLKNRNGKKEDLIKKIAQSDIVIIGGGQLLQNNNWSFPLDLHLVATILETLNKPLFIVGCGVGGKNWDVLSKFCLRALLKYKNLQGIYVRDEQSIKNLNDNFSVSSTFIPDPAITIADHLKKDRTLKNSDLRLGLGIISPSMLNRNKHLVKYSKDDHINFWTDMINKLENKGYKLSLFTTGDRSDYFFAEELKSKCKLEFGIEIELYPNANTLEQLTEQMLSFNKIISMRLHSHIIAYSYQIPSYGVIWDNKVEEFANYTESRFAFSEKLDGDYFINLVESKTEELRVSPQIMKESIKRCLEKIV